MRVHPAHPHPRAVLDPLDQFRRGRGRQPELRALVTGQHVRVGVGGDAGDDPDQDVLGPAGRHDRLQPVDVIGTVDNHQTDAVLDRHGDLFGAFRVAVQHDQRRVDAGLQRGEDLPAAGNVQPETLLRPSPAGSRCRERPWTRTPLANSASARRARSGTRGPAPAARPRRRPAPACRTRRPGRPPGNRRWSASRRRPRGCPAGTGPATRSAGIWPLPSWAARLSPAGSSASTASASAASATSVATAAGTTTTGTGEYRTILMAPDPRNTRARRPTRDDPTTSTSPASHSTSSIASAQLPPVAIAVGRAFGQQIQGVERAEAVLLLGLHLFAPLLQDFVLSVQPDLRRVHGPATDTEGDDPQRAAQSRHSSARSRSAGRRRPRWRRTSRSAG